MSSDAGADTFDATAEADGDAAAEDAAADEDVQADVSIESANYDVNPDGYVQDSHEDVPQDVQTDVPMDAKLDTQPDVDPTIDPCDPPSQEVRRCTDACGDAGTGTSTSTCASYLTCSSDEPKEAEQADWSVILPPESLVHPGLDGNGVACDRICDGFISYAFHVPFGKCARLTSSGERSFVIEPQTSVVDCSQAAECLIVRSNPGNPPSIPSGDVVLVIGAGDSPSWVRVETEDDWSQDPCALTCP